MLLDSSSHQLQAGCSVSGDDGSCSSSISMGTIGSSTLGNQEERDEGKCVEGILEIFDMLLATTSRLRELKLQHKEYLCVKAMILLNSSMFPLSSTTEEPESHRKLTHLLNSVTDALVWVIAKSGIPLPQQTTRLANLLMLLSHVRHASNKGMEHLLSMKCKNVVPVYDLLLEMLNAHTVRSHRKTPISNLEISPSEQTETTDGTQL